MYSSEDEQTPVLIPGGRHDDARGSVSFVNGFDFMGVDRFYWIQAGQATAPRGWVGHQRDHKWFSVICGEVLMAVVRPDQWQCPRRDLPVLRYTLSAANPQVLHVPPSHATGSYYLTPDAILMVFSSGKIETAKSDDFRFPVDHWPILSSDEYEHRTSNIEHRTSNIEHRTSNIERRTSNIEH